MTILVPPEPHDEEDVTLGISGVVSGEHYETIAAAVLHCPNFAVPLPVYWSGPPT
jgi:hypothetical protein